MGFKEIVNVPHLPNGSSKPFCEEDIIIVPTLKINKTEV